MPLFWQIALVAMGSALGGAARYMVVTLTQKNWGQSFPYGTMSVNVIGSFVMGFLFAYLLTRNGANDHLKLFFLTGVLGGFTTFSAFSLDAINMFENGQIFAFVFYVAGSVLLALIALLAGLGLGRLYLTG